MHCIRLRTRTVHIRASTHVAELERTPAGHVIASHALFHPEPARWSLFKPLALYELVKHAIELVWVLYFLMLLACPPLMPFVVTVEAVLLPTDRAGVMRVLSGPHEHKLTVRGWAAAQVFKVLLDKVVQRKIVKLGKHFFRKSLLYVEHVNLEPTSDRWAD
jgi:hypothetical protein